MEDATTIVRILMARLYVPVILGTNLVQMVSLALISTSVKLALSLYVIRYASTQEAAIIVNVRVDSTLLTMGLPALTLTNVQIQMAAVLRIVTIPSVAMIVLVTSVMNLEQISTLVTISMNVLRIMLDVNTCVAIILLVTSAPVWMAIN